MPYKRTATVQGRTATVRWTRGQSMGAMCCCCPSSTLQAAWRAVRMPGLKCSATCLPSRPVLLPRCPPAALQCCPSRLLLNAALYAAFLPSFNFPSGCPCCLLECAFWNAALYHSQFCCCGSLPARAFCICFLAVLLDPCSDAAHRPARCSCYKAVERQECCFGCAQCACA